MNPQPGFRPHVVTMGQGPRRVLALHCSLAFSGAWKGVSKVLDDQVTMIAPDLPSHGKSADWDGVSDFSDTALVASVSAMDSGPMDIIGHSFGAATAVRLAACHPERVRSLTLFEPVLFSICKSDAPEALEDHDRHAAAFFAAARQGNAAQAARAFNRMWSGGAKWDTLPERTRAAMTRAIPVVSDTHEFVYNDNCGLLEPGGIDSIQVPTVVMRGQHALPVIEATTRGLVRRLRNAGEVVIPGAGHMGPITHPVLVAATFAELLARS